MVIVIDTIGQLIYPQLMIIQKYMMSSAYKWKNKLSSALNFSLYFSDYI